MSEQQLETPPETPPAEPSYYLSEGVAGEGDPPDWFIKDKYQNVAEQAKAYTEAQKLVGKLGKFTGAPEGDEGLAGYSIDNIKPESVEVEIDTENPLLTQMAPVFKEMGLSQEGFDKVAQTFVLIQKDMMDAQEANREHQLSQLGAEPNKRIDNLKDFLTAQISDEGQRNALFELTSNAGAVMALEALADKIRGGKMATPPPAPAITKAEIDELQAATDEHGNRKMNDPAYRAMVRAKRIQLVGDGV